MLVTWYGSSSFWDHISYYFTIFSSVLVICYYFLLPKPLSFHHFRKKKSRFFYTPLSNDSSGKRFILLSLPSDWWDSSLLLEDSRVPSNFWCWERLNVLVAQPCLTLCDPVDCSPPGSSVLEIFQARILEWVAISFSRGSSQPRDRTRVSCTAGKFFTDWITKYQVINLASCFIIFKLVLSKFPKNRLVLHLFS